MANAALTDATGRLHAKQAELKALFDLKPDRDFTHAEGEAILAKQAELNDAGAEYDRLAAPDQIDRDLKARERSLAAPAAPMVHPGGGAAGLVEAPKSVGERFTETLAYKDGVAQGRPSFSVDLPQVSLKTLMTTAAGWLPYATGPQRTILSAQRRPVVGDLVPQSTTNQPAVMFMQESTFTNAAAPVAEGAAKPESALALTRVTVPLEVIAHLLPVTMQQLEDVDGIQQYINNRLTTMLQMAEEIQLLSGTGTSPQLQGFLTRPGLQAYARTTEPNQDAIYHAMQLVRFTGMAEPGGIVMNPINWEKVRLSVATTGQYLIAPPTEDGVERLWGKPVIQTPAIVANTALLGDFALYSHISRRDGVRIDVSDSHNDTYAKNILTIRVEERVALEVYAPWAFCKVTALN